MEEKIIRDMSCRFTIIGVHTVDWIKDHFSSNLTRFYGENLPPHSNKEKLCGDGPFTLVVVLDEHPLYRTRMTSKGPSVVNVNTFDSKEMYRYWTGGGHKIHGTNNDAEARHDLVMLTGMSKEDYLKKVEEGNVLQNSFGAMPGENNWDSMSQLLYVLNETVEYVILRNFPGLFSNYNKSVHGDIDILTSNAYLARLTLNAKPVYRNKRRVQHVVKIGDGGTFFDIRYVGDDYYCKTWEENILKTRYMTEEGYYRASDENFAYSLLYHALVQKKTIANDYMDTFSSMFPGQNEEQLKDTLLNYLNYNHYSMNEPYDYTVYFNQAITGKKMSVLKWYNKVWHKVFM